MQDKKQDGAKILTINGQKNTPEMQEERKQQLLAKRAELDALLKSGKIDGAEYNKRVVSMDVPEEYKIQQRVPIKKRRLIKIMLVIILIILAVPAAIYLNYHFYFQNTLKAEGIVLQKAEELEEDKAGEDSEKPEEKKTDEEAKNTDETPKSSLEDGPVQIMVVDKYNESGEFKGRPIDIVYKQYYDITGVVASVRDFWGFDDYSTLVPRDVCLVWGSLAETFLKEGATFHQLYRFCYGKVTSENVESAEVFNFKTPLGQTRSSLALMSNNHLIASTADIRNQISGLKVKDEVRIRGYLVDVLYNNLSLKSSTVRNDTGNGACEVIYVTQIENSGQKNNNKE